MTPPLGAWGLSGPVTPLPGGYRNTVVRVGDHVLKSTRRDEAAAAWLLPVFDMLAAHGMHAPRPLRGNNGTLVADGWTCEPWCAGRIGRVQDVAPLWADFAEAARGMPQRPGFCSSTDLQTMTQGGDVDLRDMPADLVHAIRASWAALERAPHSVVHADLTPSNILRTSDGCIILLDWDEARVDHPGFDRAALGMGSDVERRGADAWEIACCWQQEPERARTLAATFMATTAVGSPC